jgi:hypothetical protein
MNQRLIGRPGIFYPFLEGSHLLNKVAIMAKRANIFYMNQYDIENCRF